MKAQLRIRIASPTENQPLIFKFVINDFPFNACTTEDQISLHEEGITVTIAHVVYRRLKGEWAMVILCKPHNVDGKEDLDQVVESYKKKGWTT